MVVLFKNIRGRQQNDQVTRILYSRLFLPSSSDPMRPSLPAPMNLPSKGSLWAFSRASWYASVANGGVLSFGQFTCEAVSTVHAP